ncbi:interferon alpha-inducible protein 27, mitochondrial-like [Argiope bruennichi]|uniref:interferon alpha-inducible protein 27, mitochondrial-like n=1 Tax=Argiope bruennichi TaxID=94029 RepID=UPI0024945F31|nr:interferon alpha-inducible protein 27, mitochondrial-like [Argiope bruennichi]
MPSSRIAKSFIVLQLTQLNIGCYAECRCGKKSSYWDTVKETVSGASKSELLLYGVKTAAVAGAAVVATPLLVSAAGFGAGGIAAGSAAAAVQSAWFGGTISGITGTAFAALQSIGAAGLGFVGKTAVVSSSGLAVKVYDAIKGGSDDENCDCCTEIQPRN